MNELREIWADLERRRVCYNGCTRVALEDRYGAENIKSGPKPYGGWLKLTAE